MFILADLEVHYDDDDLETLVRSQSEELDTGAEPGDEASAWRYDEEGNNRNYQLNTTTFAMVRFSLLIF